MKQPISLGMKLRTQGRGGVWHFGVVVGPQPQGAAYCIVHNSKIDGLVVLDTVNGFAGGKKVYIAGRAAPGWEEFVAHDALSYVGRPYDLLGFNCEHFVNLVVDGKAESPQLQQALWQAAGIAAIGYVVHSINSPPPRRRGRRRRNVVYDRQAARFRDRRTGKFTSS